MKSWYMHRTMIKLSCFPLCFAGLNKILKEHGVTAQTIEVGGLLLSSLSFLQQLSLKRLNWDYWTVFVDLF